MKDVVKRPRPSDEDLKVVTEEPVTKSNNDLGIIGQDNLIKEVKRIFKIFKATEAKIRPHFLLTGESGSGKTFTIKSLCRLFKFNFLEINAAQLTKEGTSGNSLSKALTPLLNLKGLAIVFVDEFDKLFISGNSNSQLAHETTTGVQNEFLKVLESNTASVFGDYGKYYLADVSKCLFIFTGAFNNQTNITIDDLRSMGVKTEFLGRVGLVYNTNRLTLDNLIDILNSNPLLDMYLELFPNVSRDTVINDISTHLANTYEFNTLGARSVNTLIHSYFIKDGDLSQQEVDNLTFTESLSFDEDSEASSDFDEI